MTQHTFEAFSIPAAGWTPLVVLGTEMPPRDPDEEDEDDEDEDEGEDGDDEPAVVREPNEDHIGARSAVGAVACPSAALVRRTGRGRCGAPS